MNNFVPVIILALIVILLFLYLSYISLPWYYPIVKTSVSLNKGETINKNVIPISKGENIYVKYTVNIKAKGLGRLLTGKKITLTFKFPEAFELYSYEGIKKEKSKKGDHFITAISKNIEKTEVVLRLSYDKFTSSTDISDTSHNDTDKPYVLTFECKIPFFNVYSKMLTLCVKEQDTKKDEGKQEEDND